MNEKRNLAYPEPGMVIDQPQVVITVLPDGNVRIAPGHTLEAASELFWRLVAQRGVHRISALERVAEAARDVERFAEQFKGETNVARTGKILNNLERAMERMHQALRQLDPPSW